MNEYKVRIRNPIKQGLKENFHIFSYVINKTIHDHAS